MVLTSRLYYVFYMVELYTFEHFIASAGTSPLCVIPLDFHLQSWQRLSRITRTASSFRTPPVPPNRQSRWIAMILLLTSRADDAAHIGPQRPKASQAVLWVVLPFRPKSLERP